MDKKKNWLKTQIPALTSIASHRFNLEAMATYHRISYADVFNSDNTPKPGVEIVGVNAQQPTEIMVRLADGREVFFHWRND